MKISMLTCGTRGDTQPLVVLATELAARGHETTIAASPNTLGPVEAAGFEALPFGPDSQALMESDKGQRWLASGNVRAFVKELGDMSHRAFATTVAEAERACEGADLLVAGLLAEDLVVPVGERLGVPVVTLHSAPVRRTRAYAHPLVTTRRMPGRLNLATGALFEQVWWKGFREDVNSYRRDAGLALTKTPTPARLAASGALQLQAYDEVLVPDLEWDDRLPRVGFLTPVASLRARLGESGPDPELDTWLAAGDPPVFFGFGSMPVRDPAATVRLITEVSRAVGVRALISAGWGRLTSLNPDDDEILMVGAVDHDVVFPRCGAAVHHGGAGTVAASLGAGIPTVVCSVFADQPFWGARVVDQQVGAHLRFKELASESLERALRQALSGEVRERAKSLGERMRSGGGAAARAADLVEASV